MPFVHSERITHGGRTRSSDIGSSSLPLKLRGITESELKAWRKAVNDQSKLKYEFHYLEETFDYPFKHHDPVWVYIKEDGRWCLGKVAGRNICMGQTRHCPRGFYYPVVFGRDQQLRKYFSPLNGEMKPDKHDVRELLRRGGWLAEDVDDDNISSDGSGSNYSDL